MDIVTIKKILNSYIQVIGKTNTLFVFLFTFFVAGVTVMEPLIFSQVFKKIEDGYALGSINIAGITNILIIWVGFILFTIILLYIHRYYIVDKLVLKAYRELFFKYSKKVFNMQYGIYLGKKTGSIYKNFDRGVEVHFQLLFEFFNSLLKSTFSILIIVTILFFIDYRMAIIALSMVPVMVFLGIYFNRVTAKKQRELNERWDKIYGIIGDSMNNFLLFKTLGLYDIFNKKVEKKLNKNFEEQLKVSKQWSIADIYTAVSIMISRILVIGFGVYYLSNGLIDFYTLFVVFFYLGWIYFPLGFIFGQLKRIQENIVSVKRFYDEFEFLEKDITYFTKNNNIKLGGNIEFNNVGFSYIKGKKIFDSLSFNIDSGKRVAFVGNTGSGKSSIVSLILRLWDIDKGNISIDGYNINEISKTTIRKNIGIVTQDNSLFNLTIKENLLFAKKNATNKEIKEALKNAQADFVFELKDGINTVIGERGLKLSGGEKQRLSIARLFLKNPKILILDEATSALDNKTEKLIQKALDKLMKGRTSIVIAHRLSTIQNVDKIFMLEKGKIVETGKYDELMEKKEKFYELANPEHLIIN